MELLFAKGTSASAYPIKLIYMETPVELPYPAQAMFVVPKRSFKKSSDRNVLKRRMREVYRLNKSKVYEKLAAEKKHMLLAWLYTGRKEEDFNVIERSLLKLFTRLEKTKDA